MGRPCGGAAGAPAALAPMCSGVQAALCDRGLSELEWWANTVYEISAHSAGKTQRQLVPASACTARHAIASGVLVNDLANPKITIRRRDDHDEAVAL